MNKRLNIFIEVEVIAQAKRLAVKEGGSLSGVIQDVLLLYLINQPQNQRTREDTYQFSYE